MNRISISIIGANSYIARNFIIKCGDLGINNIKLYDIQEKHIDNYENYQKINIFSTDDLEKINYDCDLLYIFTGKTGTIQGFNEYESYIDINEKGILNILNVYVKKSSKAKIIFPSTRLVYKGQKNKKLKEDDEKEFKTIYAINKYSCEQYLRMYNNMFNVNYCIFRICVPYGTIVPGATSYGTAEFFLSKAKGGDDITVYGDGSLKRTLIYMEDLCNALIYGAINSKCINDVYNIGGADDISLYDMAYEIASLYNIKVKCIEWPDNALKIESGDTIFNSDKFDNTVDFQYKKNFKSWIRENNM